MTFANTYKKLLILPLVLSLLSVVAIAVWGLRPSLDLAGGSLLQVNFSQGAPSVAQVQETIAPLQLGEVRIQQIGQSGLLLRSRDLSNDEKNALEQSLSTLGSMQEEQYTSIGPSIGAEILHRGYVAIALVLVCIIAFIAFAFRAVSEPVASWKYGIIAIVTLAHDVLIPVGLFAVLGHFRGAEVDSLFIVALLTILGISINNTIVVFDRIRENLRRTDARRRDAFVDVVGRSIRQTIARSINTSIAVVITLVALALLGPAATQYFALTLLAGMIVGAYSSIFLASPLLVLWGRKNYSNK